MKNFLLSFLALLTLWSCKKDSSIISKASPAPSPSSTSYLSLAIGNYWVYEEYNVDTSGIETSFIRLDSVYIKKDSMIGGLTYYEFVQSDTVSGNIFPLQGLIRDSAGFVLQYTGTSGFGAHHVLFDPIHLNDTISRDTMTWGVALFLVPQNFSNRIIPSGTFNGISMVTWLRYLSTSTSSPDPGAHTDYVTGLGICYHKVGFASQPKSGFSWRLLRYHI